MVNIRYSTGSSELKNISFGIYGRSQYKCTLSDAVSAFNKTTLPSSDFTGFKAHITQSDGVTLSFNHPNDGWDISCGIFFIFTKYENVTITPKFDNQDSSCVLMYYEDETWQTSSSYVIQSPIIKLIPKAATSAKKISIKFTWDGTPQDVQFTSVIIGGELIQFDKILSADLIEEMNILSDDLPINEFDFSVVSQQDLAPGSKLSVYSNDEYFGTFWTDKVDKISQNYSGAEKVYTLECVNAIGILDKCSFDDCDISFLNGPFTAWSSLKNELKSKAKLEIQLENEKADPNYGVLGLVPAQSLRFFLCEFAWSICRWIDTARRDDIYMRSIPSAVTVTIPSDYVIGNAIYQKQDIITKAYWTHPVENIDWGTSNVLGTITLPSTSTLRKIYYGSPPAWVDINNEKYKNVKWKANYFEYQSQEATSNISVFGSQNLTETTVILSPGTHTTTTERSQEYNKFACVGIRNFEAKTAKEMGLDSTHSFIFELIKAGTYNSSTLSGETIDSANLIVTQKVSDIQKYIQSTGIVTATIILKDNLKNLRLGDMVTITTAYDGQITGIITKMEISFGYNNTAQVEICESSAFIA